jgi:hypothetical protein
VQVWGDLICVKTEQSHIKPPRDAANVSSTASGSSTSSAAISRTKIDPGQHCCQSGRVIIGVQPARKAKRNQGESQ